jgi:hypothetical protein
MNAAMMLRSVAVLVVCGAFLSLSACLGITEPAGTGQPERAVHKPDPAAEKAGGDLTTAAEEARGGSGKAAVGTDARIDRARDDAIRGLRSPARTTGDTIEYVAEGAGGPTDDATAEAGKNVDRGGEGMQKSVRN